LRSSWVAWLVVLGLEAQTLRDVLGAVQTGDAGIRPVSMEAIRSAY